MKRIAMISVHECPLASSEGKERGGINVYTFELAKALARQGIAVDAFTRVQDDVNAREVRVMENFRVIHLPNGPHKPLSKKEILASLPEFSQNLVGYMKAHGISYDVLHAHYYLSGRAAMDVNALLPRRIPIVMTFHTLGLLKQLAVATSSREDPPERVAIERDLVSACDRIITTSDNNIVYLTSLYNADGQKVVSIPPGVDTSLFTPGNQRESRRAIGAHADGPMILAVGRIDPVKGFDVLLYAMKILLHDAPDLAAKACVCIIGGDVGENRSLWSRELTKLDALRTTLDLETTVQFVRPQPQDKLADFYRAADVLVMPSHYESFGMVALEALACATPVITTDVTGVTPIVRSIPKGHIVSANNPILLAKALEHVLSRPPYGQPDGEPPVDMTPFDWKETARKIAGVYDIRS